jgi:hypothetical protein
MYLKYHQKLGHWSLLSYHNGGCHIIDIHSGPALCAFEENQSSISLKSSSKKKLNLFWGSLLSSHLIVLGELSKWNLGLGHNQAQFPQTSPDIISHSLLAESTCGISDWIHRMPSCSINSANAFPLLLSKCSSSSRCYLYK